MVSAIFPQAKIKRICIHKILWPFFISLFAFVLNTSPFGLVSPSMANAEAPLDSPRTDVSIIIYEYDIETSGPIFPGRYTFQVRNVGSMYHEVIVFKLNQGVTTEDFKKVVGSGGSLAKEGKTKGNMLQSNTGRRGA